MTRNVMSALSIFITACCLTVLVSGSRCQSDDPMRTVRQVHTDVRAAFVSVDNLVAPMLTEASDQCIAQADEQSLTGEAGAAYWRSCLENFLNIDVALATSRELLAMLEAIYDDIEAGRADNHELSFIFRQLIVHGRVIVRGCRAFDSRLPDELRSALDTLEGVLDTLCEMTNCDETSSPSS